MGDEGYIEVVGGRIWYSIQGSGSGSPLLVVHGGPGSTHVVSRDLADIGGRPVILYDQLGCGRSDPVEDPSHLELDRFASEIASLRNALGLERVHIHGGSWGAMVAARYAGTRPDGLSSLILSSPLISVARWVEDANELRALLPDGVRAVLDRHEENAYTGCPEYVAASLVFYKRHVCRLDPWPDALETMFRQANKEIYEAMWGPSEFSPTGTLLGADVSDDLRNVRCPTLFVCGEHDEATPRSTRAFGTLVPGARVEVLEGCSHTAHLEAPDRYLELMRGFLAESETA